MRCATSAPWRASKRQALGTTRIDLSVEDAMNLAELRTEVPGQAPMKQS